jgi:hypothetical protein
MNDNNSTHESTDEQEIEVGDTIEIDGKEYDVIYEFDPDNIETEVEDVDEAYEIRDEKKNTLLYVVQSDGSAGIDFRLMDPVNLTHARREIIDDVKTVFDEVVDIRAGEKSGGRNIADNRPQLKIFSPSASDDWYFLIYDGPVGREYDIVQSGDVKTATSAYIEESAAKEAEIHDGVSYEDMIDVRKDKIGVAEKLLE